MPYVAGIGVVKGGASVEISEMGVGGDVCVGTAGMGDVCVGMMVEVADETEGIDVEAGV